MDCLKNFIGIRQACSSGVTPAPRSGQYIEDYPGLSKTALQAIEPGVYLNAQAFLDDMVRQACNKIIEADMALALEPYIRTRTELEFGKVGTWSEVLSTGTDAKRGIRVRKNAGTMARIVIARVWIALDTPGDYTLNVKGGSDAQTFTFTVDEANMPVAVFTQFESEADMVDVWVVLPDGVKALGGDLSPFAEFASGHCTDCGPRSSFRMLTARALLGTTETDDVQGVIAEVGITCGLGPAVCLMAQRIKVPIFYATVLQVLENWEASARMNFHAQHKQEWVAKEWEFLANKRYPEVWDLHSKGMARFLEELDPICITCGTGTSYGYSKVR
jgi:hypothetical protein